MIVEVDLHLMKSYGLNLNEYVVLLLLNKKEFSEINKLFREDDDVLSPILKKLSEKKLVILKEYGFKGYLPDYKVIHIPKYPSTDFEAWFDELVTTYPKTARRPDGTEDNLLVNLPKCKELYKKATKNNKHNHDLIINCLKFQIDSMSRSSTGLTYMKRLYKWIEGQTWKDYEAIIQTVKHNNNEDKVTYGQRII